MIANLEFFLTKKYFKGKLVNFCDPLIIFVISNINQIK